MCIYLSRHVGDADEVVDLAEVEMAIQGKGETILVVDDEATIRHSVDEVLDDVGYPHRRAPRR